ncbi:MAG: TauD/TfdA family dioxygenase, partial [Gammaproteobacteria bacterium]
MKIEIKPSNQACGAEVIGVDLSKPLEVTTVNQIREWWLQYHVLSFPNQDINDDDLER